MQVFRVDDMTCGHCASTITQAIRVVDPGAKVDVDLAQHLVRIQPTEMGATDLAMAITEAGYTPVPVQTPQTSAPAARSGGCCCGNGSGCSA
jgi:copper chaperone